ncbi:MAG: hypothetical protein E7812_08260 [Phenylobacterium sp.]|nr:MAG: hypothetical protein E7812_08260 [Phenylobacterium sp.]
MLRVHARFATVLKLVSPARPPIQPRRRLVGEWTRDADGRLICAWRIESEAPDPVASRRAA